MKRISKDLLSCKIEDMQLFVMDLDVVSKIKARYLKRNDLI